MGALDGPIALVPVVANVRRLPQLRQASFSGVSDLSREERATHRSRRRRRPSASGIAVRYTCTDCDWRPIRHQNENPFNLMC